MRILIVYYTQTGRTKKIAEAIGSSFTNHQVEFIRFEVMGSFSHRFQLSGKIRSGDYSSIQDELNSLNNVDFDLVIIGMPTHGGPPPNVFNKIVDSMEKLNGKKVVVFNTARMTGSKTPDMMAAKLEERGADIIDKRRFKGFFRLGTKEAIEFGKKVNQKI